MNEQVINEKNGIYNEPKLNSLPGYYGRDIIKVLSKNPREVVIFWGISEQSFSMIASFFKANLEDIHYKLYVRYTNEAKHTQFLEVYLQPFTTSYVLKFDSPVKNLRVEVIAFNSFGNIYSLMHSAHVNTPINKPSIHVHHEWIHPKWIQHGNYLEKVEENLIIRSGGQSSEYLPEEIFTPVWESTVLYDGSSGFSSHSIPSSIHKRKE